METTNLRWISRLQETAKEFNQEEHGKSPTIDGKRRGRRTFGKKEEIILSIGIDGDGIIRLGDGRLRLGGQPGLRKGRRNGVGPDKILDVVKFEKLPPSEIYSALEKMDRKLTPEASGFASSDSKGLRKLENGHFTKVKKPAIKGKILLFVHGTFSNNDNLKENLETTNEGKNFLKKIESEYDEVLAFDHRTLGVSPMINAREMALLFNDSNAEIDIVCHSRGGLVSRWWAEVFDTKIDRRKRIVFVASPLGGTGLASPHNIRQTMELLSNYSNALAFGSSLFPFLNVITILAQAMGSITSLASRTPAVDAAIALVPGIDSMSQVNNNHELVSLHKALLLNAKSNYFVVKSNFESDDVGWKFWKNFTRVGSKTADLAADVVFDGENDLVVDTNSMTSFTQNRKFVVPKKNVLDFGTNNKVHHINYFCQAETVKFIEKKLLSL